VPEQLRVVLRTSGDDQRLERRRSGAHHVGSALVSQEPARTSGVAALARFVALTNLDVLADGSRVAWSELPESERTAGVARARAGSRRAGAIAAARLRRIPPACVRGGRRRCRLGEGLLEARY
jgi:hypothetical protein